MKPYHIDFGFEDLGSNPPKMVLLSGEPERSRHIANTYLDNTRLLSEYRGLISYIGYLPNDQPILSLNIGMNI